MRTPLHRNICKLQLHTLLKFQKYRFCFVKNCKRSYLQILLSHAFLWLALSAFWWFFFIVMLNLASTLAFCLLAYTLTMQKWVLVQRKRGGGGHRLCQVTEERLDGRRRRRRGEISRVSGWRSEKSEWRWGKRNSERRSCGVSHGLPFSAPGWL